MNSRRLAERLAGALNELAGEPLVRSHHGSLAREARTEVEDLLKAGRIRALVATSSLELGIDMGAIDLVVQIEAPPSVASGLQRIGRAGHQAGAVSEGIIFPKFRGDLVACAAVARAMHDGAVESTRYPRNPLDVLAQQIVAMAASETWPVDELFALVRRAAPFADLSRRDVRRRARHAVGTLSRRTSSPSCGRASRGIASATRSSDAKAPSAWRSRTPARFPTAASTACSSRAPNGLRASASWTRKWCSRRRSARRSRSARRHGGSRRSRTTACSCRRRPASRARCRSGTAIRQDGRSNSVTPSASWCASFDRCRAMAAVDRLVRRHALEPAAAEILLRYLDDQAASGGVPDDRTIVIERSRDDLGDWRVCLLSPLGSRIHAPWAMAASAEIRRRTGADVHVMWGDEGFVVRFPATDEPPDPMLLLPTGRFGRAPGRRPARRLRRFSPRASVRPPPARCSSPAGGPGRRTPLWQQRKRATDLLAVASRYGSFPAILETYREILRDHFDMPALVETLRNVSARTIRVVALDSRAPSPFAASLLFGYVANYIYDGDAPLAERRAQALSVDQAQLRELLGDAELRDLLDAARSRSR